MSPAELSLRCDWCDRPFLPRRSGGRAQRFCLPACRRAHDAAARARGRAEIESERTTVASVVSGPRTTRALLQRQEAPPPVLSEGAGDPPFPEAPARFIVEIPSPTIQGFVKLGWLRPDQRDDLQAIMGAMRRLGARLLW